MSKINYKDLASNILNLIGGSKNVNSLVHCSTRLRFDLYDTSKADVEAIKQLKGVIGVVISPQFQIIIGTDVNEVYESILEQGELQGDGSVPDDVGTKEKKKIGAIFLDFMIGVFSPLVPALTGAGLIKAFFSLFATLGWLSSGSGIYQVFNFAADTVFFFLPVMVAFTTAQKVKCDKMLAVSIVAVTLLPKFTAALAAEAGLEFLGFVIPNYSYSSQIFPAILTVLFLSIIEKNFAKICPKPVRPIFVPVLCVLVVIPVSLLFLSPLGFMAGDVFTNGLLSLHGTVGWIVVAILGALLPFLTAMGMHKPLVPYITVAFATTGFEMINAPAKVAHNISEAGACFAVALKAKDTNTKSTALSAGISAFFGITEPALYGVTLQNKKAMVGVVVSGFVAAAFMGIFSLKSLVLTGTGILGIVQFIDPTNPKNLIVAAIGYILAISVSFIITMLLYKENK